LAELDRWIEKQKDPPSRPEAIRRLVELAQGEEMSDKRMRPIRLIPIRLIEPWRCATPPGWREYAAMMRAGDEFPPVQVIRQSSKLHGYPYRLFDGYHRTRAAKHIGRRTIAAHVISDETMTWVARR
jgi:hypothetical protein